MICVEELAMSKVGRNEPCPCGSGKKYKACCLGKHTGFDSRDTFGQKLLMWVVIGILGVGLIAGVLTYVRSQDAPANPPGKVWSEEHQHWH
jgi:hypothetical protein